MIDFHTHILPKMDDGSKSTEESIAMLKMQAEQGIRWVVATPHFYAEHESPQDFLQRRNHSYQSLQKEIERQGLQDQLPKIRLGAEVRYFEGISHSSAVHDLKIENTDLLLLEMPFVPWSQRMIQEVKAAQQFNLTILLAHVERYRKTQGFFFHKKLEEMNEEQQKAEHTDGKAFSMIVHMKGTERSYQIEVAPPEGKSYASEIAQKYGVTYEMLVK